jgi:hypothetical protein
VSRGRRVRHSRDGALRAAPGKVAGRGPRHTGAPRPREPGPRRAGDTLRTGHAAPGQGAARRESAQGVASRQACRRQGQARHTAPRGGAERKGGAPGASCVHLGRPGMPGSAARRGESATRGEGEGRAGARKKKGGAEEEEGVGLTAGVRVVQAGGGATPGRLRACRAGKEEERTCAGGGGRGEREAVLGRGPTGGWAPPDGGGGVTVRAHRTGERVAPTRWWLGRARGERRLGRGRARGEEPRLAGSPSLAGPPSLSRPQGEERGRGGKEN